MPGDYTNAIYEMIRCKRQKQLQPFIHRRALRNTKNTAKLPNNKYTIVSNICSSSDTIPLSYITYLIIY